MSHALHDVAHVLDGDKNSIEYKTHLAAQHQLHAVHAVATASKDMGERIVHLEQAVAKELACSLGV